MKDNTSHSHHAPHAWILGRMSFNFLEHYTINFSSAANKSFIKASSILRSASLRAVVLDHVYDFGSLVCTIHSDVHFLSYQSDLLPLELFCLIVLLRLFSFPRCHVPACLLLLHLCIFSMRPHAHRRTICRCSRPDHSSSFSHRASRNFPDPLVVVRRLPSFPLLMISHCYMISSNPPVPSVTILLYVLLSIIFLTQTSSAHHQSLLNWCSYSATLNDHAVNFSLTSFALLHLLGLASMGCSAFAGSFDELGAYRSTTACHATSR